MEPLYISLGAAAVSVAALVLSLRRKRLTVEQLARLACDHGQAMATPTLNAWRLAHEAARKLDLDDNGRRDYSDERLAIAVDTEAKRRGWKR